MGIDLFFRDGDKMEMGPFYSALFWNSKDLISYWEKSHHPRSEFLLL